MDWGMPTLLEAASPESAAALCRELGLQFVELNMNLPEYQEWDFPLLQRVASRYQIYYTIHLDENLDPCYFNPHVAKAYLDAMLDAIEAAKRLRIPVINMHLAAGVYFTLPGEKVYLYDRYRERYLDRLQAAIAQCEKAAAGASLVICLENTGDFALPYKRAALELFLQSPLFGLTFDIGHNQTAGNRDKPFFLEHWNRLRHFHIHDAAQGKNHLPLGTGVLDIPWYAALAEKTGSRAVVEVKTIQALRDSVQWLRKQGLGPITS